MLSTQQYSLCFYGGSLATKRSSILLHLETELTNVGMHQNISLWPINRAGL